jgi:hypothetical protein
MRKQYSRTEQKARNTESERQGRRWARRQRMAGRQTLPGDVQKVILLRGLARPTDSVRGQLLSAVLAMSILDPDGRWIFDGAIRDLAQGGLADGRVRDPGYLCACMRDFVRQGILEEAYRQKGRPVMYAVRV